ncbi:DegV family protein with EDD domain [Lachnospiraceae bacterium PF1-4]
MSRMNDYVITCNSTVDAPKEWLEERNITVIPLHYTIDGKTYEDMAGLSPKEFFAKLREGHMAETSQVNPEEAKEIFRPLLEAGKDVLHIAFSSGLSGTCNSCRMAAEELSEEFPERKIVVIDSLCACLGEALLLYYAVKQKNAGKTLEQVEDWVEENKLRICHNVTVDDLGHLHRGGRVSKASAIIGSAIQIKPMIHVDNEGKLAVIGKKRGRKQSLQRIVEMTKEQSKGISNDIIMITHGDCLDDANYVADLIRTEMGIENILINNIGTVIGGHTGPGVVATFNLGEFR